MKIMAKRLQEYVKYTTIELDQYAQTEGSCVLKINTNLHFSMGPYCLGNFKHALASHLMKKKVGFYDIHLDGIVLDVKKIKVLGTTGAMRADDPRIHVNINADVYIFKPVESAVLTGVVKHIGPHQVGVILYRVFNANLRVTHKVDKSEVQMDQEVKFCIRKYNLQHVFPYIDGELMTTDAEHTLSQKITVFKEEVNSDSGIEEKDGAEELDSLLLELKKEEPTEYEEVLEESRKNKSKKNKARSKEGKSPSSISSKNVDDTEALTAPSPKKIKSEKTYTHKKIKKEKNSSCTKREKTLTVWEDVQIKEEITDVVE